MEENAKHQEELSEEVTWIARPAVTLLVTSVCPKCKAQNSFDMDRVLTSNPPQYVYRCRECGFEKTTSQGITSIIYVDKEAYDKQVQETGSTEVRGTFQ